MAEITVHFPAILYQSNNLDLFLLGLLRFFIVFTLLIPFEILDSETDDKVLKTIPQRLEFGIQKWLGLWQ